MNQEKAATARQEVEKFVVRLPKGMRAKIAEVSRLSHRSMNSEIIARLEESLAKSGHGMDGSPSTPMLRAVGGQNEISAAQQERELVARFRNLSPAKRSALLELMR